MCRDYGVDAYQWLDPSPAMEIISDAAKVLRLSVGFQQPKHSYVCLLRLLSFLFLLQYFDFSNHFQEIGSYFHISLIICYLWRMDLFSYNVIFTSSITILGTSLSYAL